MTSCNMTIIESLARFMGIFARVHYLNFHGQPGARLDVDQSVYESPKQRARKSVALRIADPFLFGGPSKYLKTLQSVWVDHTVIQPRWRAFIGALNAEWAGFTIYSTVMLAVDVGLLGAPGVDQGKENFQPVSVIAIYVSTLCTVGSLVASVILTGESRRFAGNTSDEMARYMTEMTSSLIGIDHMAIMYSVPFGLLGWGMMSFVIALTSIIFNSTYTPTLVTIGSTIVLVSIFVAWPMWVDIERSISEHILGRGAAGKDTVTATRTRGIWEMLRGGRKRRETSSGVDSERCGESSRSSSLTVTV